MTQDEDKKNNADIYQNTLNLPQTEFPMKASLSVREPEMIKKWDGEQLYNLIQEKNKANKEFVMPDGPPYANGNIHIGHCLDKLLKDFAIKYRSMIGLKSAFIPGWDCHGLPIEHAVSKELGNKKREKTDAEFRGLCRAYAEKFVASQKEQFRRLGVLADWDHPYRTMDYTYEADVVRSLAKIYDNGFVYRGEKPVNWCWSDGTALAEAEVEYADRKDPSIYVKFEVVKGLQKLGNPENKTYVVIWTTTPWSLPANLAVSIHPDFEYGLFEVDGSGENAPGNLAENWIIALELEGVVETATGQTLTLLKKFKGKDIGFGEGSQIKFDDRGENISISVEGTEGLVYQHPFISSRQGPVILGDHVTLDAGTGAVHTAPAHGVEDYLVCKNYGIASLNPVDDWGKYSDLYPDMKGIRVFDANPKIIENLKLSKHLAAEVMINHSFPHCWRCHNPVIFRATSQWFISMDEAKSGESLRARALREIKYVKWIPAWGQNRITAMVENRPDWCISRQRLWGVPIPVYYCESCGQYETSGKLMNLVADRMEKEGLESWYSSEITDYQSDKKSCSKCGHDKFRRGKDILDVWFDSGVCHEAVQAKRYKDGVPADLYSEGSDQHRGWFQSSLMTSVAMNDKAPFKTVLTHGFVNDAQGRKMSKSLGNVVDPLKFIEKSGAEILRLWTSYEDYTNDLAAGQESFDRVTESYRRVRNTCRYILSNLSDFDPSKDTVEFEKLFPIDKWALSKLYDFMTTSKQAYEAYEYHKIYHALQNYCTVDLSATYLDILKDRLYTFKKTGPERRAAQTVIYQILRNLVGVMAPILSFLCEEVYASLPGEKAQSIFLTDFPVPLEQWKHAGIESEWAQVFEVRSFVQKHLEEARKEKLIGASLEAKVLLALSREDMQTIKKYENDLPSIFIVSQVVLSESAGTSVRIQKADGEKCVRCWNYSILTGAESRFPGVCPKCVKALA